MKRTVLSLLLAVGVITASMAQSGQYEAAMSKQVALLDDPANFNPQSLREIGNTFERIAEAEKTQWLPYYYAGYCAVMQALMQEDKSKVDEIADKAALHAAKADSLNKGNDEIACLQSLIATSRIGVDPPTRGMRYGMESGTLLEQARKINPENPRVYLLQGQAFFYTPEQFGGSKPKAKELFELALQKFASFKPASAIAPHWGEARTRDLLGQIK